MALSSWHRERRRRTPTLKRSWPLTILFVILLIGYCGFLVKNACYALAGSDSTGYVSFARSIVKGDIVKRPAELSRFDLPDDFREVFMPLGHSRGRDPGTIAPMY